MTVSVGAWLISRDGASRTGRWLEALGWADKAVAVVDRRSRDASETVARRRGA